MSSLKKLQADFFYASAAILLGFVLIILFLLVHQEGSKRRLMAVFLDIPERTAKFMNAKCINFMQQLVAGEDEEMHSEEALLLGIDGGS
jgi:high-affinity Fe2+/Pb2+ permease